MENSNFKKFIKEEVKKIHLKHQLLKERKRILRELEELEDDFNPQGYYTVSNTGGYEVEIDNSGDQARLKLPNGKITDWLDIEYVPKEDNPEEHEPVIDPNGYNVPLNLVMRFNR